MDDNQHASFGDTRMSDERSHVSGSYHLLLPDERHQHVNYKDEGSASNLVEYKQNQEIQKDYNQEQPIDYTRSSTHSIPLTKRNVDKIIRRNSPQTHVSTTTEFSPDNVVFTYAPEEYGTWEIMYTIPKYLQPSSTTTTNTEKPNYVTNTPAARLVPIYNNRIVPSSSNNIIRTPINYSSTTTTVSPITKAPRVPHPVTTKITTLPYKKIIWKTFKKKPVNNRPVPSKTIATIKKPANQIPRTTKRPAIAAVTPSVYHNNKVPSSIVTNKSVRNPVIATKPVLNNRKPISPIHKNPVNRIPISTTYRPITRYHTTKRITNQQKDISKKPYVIYRPSSSSNNNKVPILKKIQDPYVIAPSHKVNAYAAAPPPPAPTANNHIPPAYTVILYKSASKLLPSIKQTEPAARKKNWITSFFGF